MPLDPGTHVGPYEVVAFLGSGGMGEVYEAVDTRLNRRVALKVLPPALVANADRRRRFLQEAQLASALQHANIVTIFDIGTAGDTDYLAMELVRGRRLDAAIPSHGMRVIDALRLAVQIADALAAAHAAGIVHRDLKPANVMVTDQDQIKILDFGLATLADRGLIVEGDETRLQTHVSTGAGTILGTVAYMSPEQAEGKKVDARSDIFSFGAILYEMLSGQRAFQGDSTPATLAAVINQEPRPLSKLAADVPQGVERLVSRCLRKDLSRRAQHASDVKISLEELREDSASGVDVAAAPARRPRGRMAPVLAGAAAVLAAAIVVLLWWPRAAPPPSAFVTVPLTALPGSEEYPSFSPDATQVAFAWTPAGALGPDVYVQFVNGSGTRLRLSSDGAFHGFPAWSPDGKWIATWHGSATSTGYQLNLISPLGGPERQLLSWNDFPCPIAWSPDSRWLAISPVNPRGDLKKGLVLLSPETGERVDWAALDPAFIGSAEPAFSSDGKRLAFTRTTGDFTGSIDIVAVGSDGRPHAAPVTVPYKGQQLHNPVWTVDGRSLLVIEGDSTSNGGVTRIPIDDPDHAQRLGGLEHVKEMAISRDGRSLAVSRGGDNSEIWRFDLRNPSRSTGVASSTLWDGDAAYSPDGRRMVFASNRNGGRELWVADADGENALPITHFDGPVPGTPRWSPDGRQIVFDGRPDGNSDIFAVPANGGPVRQLTRTPGEDARPAWSADGQSVFFSSDRSGRSEIWRMSADGQHPTQVTKNGGVAVLASPEGSYVFYKRTADRIFRIRDDGTDDAPFTTERTFAFLPFAVTSTGLWFVSAPATATGDWSLQVMRLADRRTSEALRFDWQPNGLAISVSPDEQYVLVTRPDTSGTDLLLVSDFK